MDKEHLVGRLVDIINSIDRPAPLRVIGFLRYPPRGINIRDVENGMVEIRLALWGYEYKSRSKPFYPLWVNREKIQDILNDWLKPQYEVLSVLDDSEEIILLIEERSTT